MDNESPIEKAIPKFGCIAMGLIGFKHYSEVMAKKEICDICGDEIFLEPENTESHRGGSPGKMGFIEYEDGKPRYICRDHVSF